MLNPCSAILIESREALPWRYVVGITLIGRSVNEVKDGLLCGSVIPGWQRIGLRLRRQYGATDKKKTKVAQIFSLGAMRFGVLT